MNNNKGCLVAFLYTIAVLFCLSGVVTLAESCKGTTANPDKTTAHSTTANTQNTPRGSRENSTGGSVVCLLLGAGSFFLAHKLSNKTSNYSPVTANRVNQIFLSQEQISNLVSNGEIPVVHTPVLLKKDEFSIFYCEATRQEVKDRVVGRTGGYKGYSFRIWKGFTYHTGGMKSTPIHANVSTHYQGQMVVTNKRIVFINPEKGFEVSLSSLTSMQYYQDAVSLQTSRANYVLLISCPDLLHTLFNNVERIGQENLPNLLRGRV